MHAEENSEPGDGDADGEQREQEAVLERVGEEGYEHGESEGRGPRGDGVDCGC